MKILAKLFKNKSHNLCLFHFYCQRKNKERYKEPYFAELAKAFWVVNGVIITFHLIMASRWYAYLIKQNLADIAGPMIVLPFISIIVAALFAFLYRYPQYSNVPYSLILEELPTKRQDEIRYVFKQLTVTSAGYFAVFFLTVNIHMIGSMVGIKNGFFIGLYAFLMFLILAKFGFATWFIKATRK